MGGGTTGEIQRAAKKQSTRSASSESWNKFKRDKIDKQTRAAQRNIGEASSDARKSLDMAGEGVIDWYDNTLGSALTNVGQKVGQWISDNMLGWLPDAIETRVKAFFENMDWGKWVKNLALGAMFILALKFFGFGKLLAPIATILT